MLLFNIYYKNFGIRKPQQLLKPRVFPLSALEFPRNSIFHYLPIEDELGPDAKLSYFTDYKKRIPITHITELTEVSKGGRKLSDRHLPLIKTFQSKQKQFRLNQHAVDNFHDVLVPIVYNYAIIPQLYKYIETPIANYSKWHDLNKTVFATINAIASKSQRNHFIFIDIPTVIPSITNLRLYENKLNASFMSVFDSAEKCYVMEFWRWLDDSLDSVINQLSPEAASLTNCVFFHNSNWCLLNLGTLKQWHKSKDGTAPIQFSTDQLQKLFLRLFNSVKEQAVIDLEPIETATVQTTAPNTAPPLKNFTQNFSDAELEQDIDNSSYPLDSDTDPYASYDDDSFKDDVDMTDIFNTVDSELEALDHIQDNLYHTKVYKTSPVNDSPPIKTKGLKESSPLELEPVVFETKEELQQVIYHDKSAKEALGEYLDFYTELGVMSANDYRGLVKQIDAVENLQSPYDPKQSLLEYAVVTPEQLKLDPQPLPNLKHVPDPSMHKTALIDFDQKYIKEILPKDIVASVANIQKAGIIIQDYDIDSQSSILGDYEIHTLKLRPIDGVPNTIRFKLPKVAPNGEFKANGKKYQQRKQRSDLPIRKIKPHTVALTSYYGKVFVSRSEKKAYDSDSWLIKHLTLAALDDTNTDVLGFTPTNVFDNKFIAPRIYSGMAKYFKNLDLANYHLVFDHHDRLKLFDPTTITSLEINGDVIVGKAKNNSPIVVDTSNVFHLVSNKGKVPIGTLASLAMIDQTKMPLDFSYLKVFRKEIPLALVLGYFFGISRLLVLLDVKPTIIPAKKRFVVNNDEWVLAFKDRKLIFKRDNYLANLILAGFIEYKGSVRHYEYQEFDNSNVYLNVLESKGISVRYLREIELMDQLFIDPITKGILEDMREPTTFMGLIMRSNELLTTDDHPDSQDMHHMRIKGYERFAGIVYSQLAHSLRDYKSRNIRGKSKIEMSPYAVWRDITTDPANSLESDINPIEVLKIQESVTYLGVGGRGKESMNRETRIYHKNDMGVISESTVDSGDVGVNAYTSSNPLIKSMRGITDNFDYTKHGSGNLLSTTANLWPSASSDEFKRVNIASIQASHTVATQGYHQPFLRTGYEEVVPYRVTDLYAVVAKKPGKVISKNVDGIVVEYNDGEVQGVELGIRMGSSEGSTYPHNITSFLNEGDLFEAGHTIAYNDGFFEPDILDPRKVIWKTYMTVKTALYESTQTHEDSCAISKKISADLTTKTSQVRSFVINFDQGVRNVIKPGTKVGPNDVIFIIEDEITNTSDLFDEESLSTLQMLSNKAPKAKIKGIVERYEVYYNGDLEDMSPTLRELAEASDKRLIKKQKSANKSKMTGRVDSEYRVEGNPLNVDSAEIKVYIIKDTKAGVGDKTVFAAQMKSVIGEVLDYPVTTESGQEIDAIFGAKSIYNRIVTSPFVMGTTITLLKVIAQKAVSIYRS
jgi:hypothetical protein